MDNFDHEENSSSGIGGSHNTILVLFQNTDGNEEDTERYSISQKSTSNENEGKRSLDRTLGCQKLVRARKFPSRAEISKSFAPAIPIDLRNIQINSLNKFELWAMTRYTTKHNIPVYSTCDKPFVPSFTETNSLIFSDRRPLTRIAFTPIIPYPATEFDTIHTCMVNFQDVLTQKGLSYGPLWCDEGVYRIAKELQLLNPDAFSNIFLGLGGFHLEKVIIACCGKYLEESGVDIIFVENEIFGPSVVNSVMSGGNYIRGKRGMALISEALVRLQLLKFFEILISLNSKQFSKK